MSYLSIIDHPQRQSNRRVLLKVTKMQQHKLSSAFPAMTPAEFQALVDDIRANGQRHPIITYQGAVIDGFHRLRACIECEKDPWLKPYEGNDPAGYVLSSNLHRRHLSASQRAGAIVACNEWRNDGQRGPEKLRNIAELPQTTAKMAETAQVSTRTIESAKAAHNAGFGDDVRDGKISVNAAAAKAKPQELKPVEPKVKRELPTVPGPDLNAELDRLCNQLDDMRAELIELRAASHDEQLRNQARDEIAGLREALRQAQQSEADAIALRGADQFKILELQKHNAWLEKKLKSP